jgi:hypothetical protein
MTVLFCFKAVTLYSRALLYLLRYPGFGGLEEQYSLIIQSGLARILDLVKTAPDTSKLDQISLLEAIKVPPGIYFYIH